MNRRRGRCGVAGVVCAVLVSASGFAQGTYRNRGGADGAGEAPRAGAPEAPQEKPLPKNAVQIRQLIGTGRQTLFKTPEYSIKTTIPRSNTRPREWVQISTKFDTAPEWIGALSVAYTVLALEEAKGKKVYSLYRETVEYVDVERGRDHVCNVYLAPSAVKRYGMPVAVYVAITVDGQLAAQEVDVEAGTQLPAKWWESSEVLNKVITREGYLLKANATPFVFVNSDDFEVTR